MTQIPLDEHGRKIFTPDGPYLAAFLIDRSKVSIIRGPIGSGTSSAAMQKMFQLACEQAPGLDGVRMTRWLVARDCYDDQTEILTEKRGWVFFRDLEADDRVAQLNGDQLEFVKPVAHIAKPYVGEMIGFESEGVDFRVTPNHRLWASKTFGREKRWLPHGFVTAEQAYKTDLQIRRDAEWQGVPTHLSEAMFEWLGLWFAEGSGNVYSHGDGYPRPRLLLTQCKADGINYARELFVQAGIAFTETSKPEGGTNFRVSRTLENAWLFDLLCLLGGALKKTIPPILKSAPAGHLRAFLKGFIAGDGHIRKSGRTSAFTSSKRLADDLQELALKCGMVANINARDRSGLRTGTGSFVPTSPEYTVSFISSGRSAVRIDNYRQRGRWRGWYRERYAGTIYCLTVPSHVIYVRRNGKAFWCGQSYPALETTTIKTWLNWFPENLYGKMIRTKPYYHHIKVGDVDMEVYFIGLDDDDAIGKLRSFEITGAFFNELEFSSKEIFDEAMSRTGRYPPRSVADPTWYGLIADLNAPPEDHWLPALMEEVPPPEDVAMDDMQEYTRPEGWCYLVQPPALIEVKGDDGKTVKEYRINPEAENLKWLPDGYYEGQVKGKTKSWIDSRLMNRIIPRVDGKRVWPEFTPEVHVAQRVLAIVPGQAVFVGFDFGRSPGVVFAQCINDRWFVQHEMGAQDIPTSAFAIMVRKFLTTTYPGHLVRSWGDPKGRDRGQNDDKTAYQVYQANGITIEAAPIKQNNIRTRIDVVSTVLNEMRDGKPRLLISPNCRGLIMGMAGGYHYKKIAGTGRYSEEPEKNKWSHKCDALQYLLLGAGEGRAMTSGVHIPGQLGSRPMPVRVRHIHSRRRVS